MEMKSVWREVASGRLETSRIGPVRRDGGTTSLPKDAQWRDRMRSLVRRSDKSHRVIRRSIPYSQPRDRWCSVGPSRQRTEREDTDRRLLSATPSPAREGGGGGRDKRARRGGGRKARLMRKLTSSRIK